MEWYCWLGALVFVGWLAFRLGKHLPNGDAVMWHHKLVEGHHYFVWSVNPSRSLPANPEKCATVQDKECLYNSFHIFLPMQKDQQPEAGDTIQLIYRNGHAPFLCVTKKSQPAQVC